MDELIVNEPITVTRMVPPRPAAVEVVQVTRENAIDFQSWVESHGGKFASGWRTIEVGYDVYPEDGPERIVVHASYGDHISVTEYGHFANIGDAAGYDSA